MNDEIRAILVRSMKDVGLAEMVETGCRCLELLNVKANRLCQVSRGITAERRYLKYTICCCDRKFVKSVVRKKIGEKKPALLCERKNGPLENHCRLPKIHRSISLAASQICENLECMPRYKEKWSP